MKNNKGFTLMELLAVIVILAIIALIVTPVVTKIIAQARESANARSVEGHVTDVNYAILSLTMGSGKDISTYDKTAASLATEVSSTVTTTNKSDTVKCTSYTIANGIVTDATGCKASDWTSAFKYSSTSGTTKQ